MFLCYLWPDGKSILLRSKPSTARESLCVLRQIPYDAFTLVGRCLICRDTEHQLAKVFQSGGWLQVIRFGPVKKAWFPDTAEHSGFRMSFFWCINCHLQGKKNPNLMLLSNVSSPKPAAILLGRLLHSSSRCIAHLSFLLDLTRFSTDL